MAHTYSITNPVAQTNTLGDTVLACDGTFQVTGTDAVQQVDVVYELSDGDQRTDTIVNYPYEDAPRAAKYVEWYISQVAAQLGLS